MEINYSTTDIKNYYYLSEKALGKGTYGKVLIGNLIINPERRFAIK